MKSAYDEFLEEIEELRKHPPYNGVEQDKMLKIWFEQFLYDAKFIEVLGKEWLNQIKRLNCNLKFTPLGKHIYNQRLKKMEETNERTR